MPFGIYIHIPFCLQKCSYCDFTTFGLTQVISTDDYVELIIKEINTRHSLIPIRELDSIYFGGGTPSLLSPQQIVSILECLANAGFQLKDQAEITLEINPGTLSKEDYLTLKHAGVNRFSLGGQTFNDPLLKKCGRDHNAQATHDDLKMLTSLELNYSFDLLFGLPDQGLQAVEQDLDILLEYSPPHISTYCLTLPERHALNVGRATDDEQVLMYDLIESRLADKGIERYEISNFAKKPFRSRHNQIYWNDQPYWGIGISSHSFEPNEKWGIRFWNPKSISLWQEQLNLAPENKIYEALPAKQVERLEAHEAMTDFCYTQLRKVTGLNKNTLRYKWPEGLATLIEERLGQLVKKGWAHFDNDSWSLTAEGQVLSNQAFSLLTFLSSDLTRERIDSYL